MYSDEGVDDFEIERLMRQKLAREKEKQFHST